MRKTKILATIGPATENKKVLKDLIEAGADSIRINASHTDEDQLKKRIKLIRSVKDISIVLDTQGPEIRLLAEQSFHVKKGQKLKLGEKIGFNVPIKCDGRILLDEGILELNKRGDILTAQSSGIIKDRARVNIPSSALDLPILSKRDRSLIKIAMENKVEFIALSYTRRKKDIEEVRKILHGSDIQLIAKIENKLGVDNFDEILEASDGVMVARGDLGVEIEAEKLPMLQKHMIKECNQNSKLVITATQMLQSMITNSRPTRAETSDVANAILDGTDVIMLSGETAIGKYPIKAVKEMCLIAKEIENNVESNVQINGSTSISEAISKTIHDLTNLLPIKKIVTLTSSGYTARIISRFRLKQDIIAITKSEHVVKKLNMYYGVTANYFPEMPPRDRIRKLTKHLYKKKILSKEDMVLFTAGLLTMKPGSTNLIEIHIVKDLLEL